MAAVAPSADKASDLLQKLSLDSQPKKEESVDANKKTSSIPYGSVNGTEAQNGSIQSDRSVTPVLPDYMDPSACLFPSAYSPYYYGGYDGSLSEWDSRYGNRDGVEMPLGVYGDMYHGYGYAPYGAYPSPGSPVPTIGTDGQMYAPQHYQYPAPFYQPATPTATQNPNAGSKPDSKSDNKPVVSIDSTKSDGTMNGTTGQVQLKQNGSGNNVNGSYRAGVQNGYGYNNMPWFDASLYTNGQHRPNASSVNSTVSHANNGNARNQNNRASPNFMGMQRPATGMAPTAPNYLNRMYPDARFYNQYNSLKPNLFNSTYNSRLQNRWNLIPDKFNKSRSANRPGSLYGFGPDNQDGFSELNRGPRSGGFKNPKPIITLVTKGSPLPKVEGGKDVVVPDRAEFNKEEFEVKYEEAKFFVIKSYSEDDVHKSVKYGVWASTPNGNKKLDAGFREAKEKSGNCPVFLFFSVNTSGQFVGVAEMTGPVDFDKTVEYWQQDKWNGCFPVKWHIVKDLPNSMLKHIILENNDNKPVTNSRDTQEIKLEQGLEILKIFKDFVGKTCILDDFLFYENRQKLMQEKKAKQQLQNQVWDEKKDNSGEKENEGAKPRIQKPLVSISAPANKEGIPNGNCVAENCVANGVASDSVKILKPVEKRTGANGVTEAC
ncbi:hypothetical protein LUZ60_006649 [Juncus effusus]|nr:hypothetical protein LUZ60_006649 [Juncus effusus]